MARRFVSQWRFRSPGPRRCFWWGVHPIPSWAGGVQEGGGFQPPPPPLAAPFPPPAASSRTADPPGAPLEFSSGEGGLDREEILGVKRRYFREKGLIMAKRMASLGCFWGFHRQILLKVLAQLEWAFLYLFSGYPQVPPTAGWTPPTFLGTLLGVFQKTPGAASPVTPPLQHPLRCFLTVSSDRRLECQTPMPPTGDMDDGGYPH